MSYTNRIYAMLAAGAAASASALPALAHDIVIFPEWKDGAVVVDVKYGHPQDYQPIAFEKLYSFAAVEPGKAAQSWRDKLKLDGMDLKMTQKPAWRADSGVMLLTAQYDNGYWSKNEDGKTVNTSKITYPKSATGSHNLKYAKALVASGASHAGFDAVVGHKLELIPLADPLTLKVGDKLPVAVRFNGKPLAGAGVEIGDSVTAIPEERIPRFKTDAKGVALVPIGKAGWEVVGVDHEEKSPTPRLADKEKYTATLVFRLP